MVFPREWRSEKNWSSPCDVEVRMIAWLCKDAVGRQITSKDHNVEKIKMIENMRVNGEDREIIKKMIEDISVAFSFTTLYWQGRNFLAFLDRPEGQLKEREPYRIKVAELCLSL